MRGIRGPIPDFVLKELSEEEWWQLPPYTRHRIKERGYIQDGRFGSQPNRIKFPKFLQGKYTWDEWLSFNAFKRYHLSHPEKVLGETRKRKFTRGEKEFQSKLKREYSMTVEEYNIILEQQNFVCAICQNPETITYIKEVAENQFVELPRRLAVDHEHSTGIIRGLLCTNCNSKIRSHNGEAINWLKSALAYLEKAESKKKGDAN